MPAEPLSATGAAKGDAGSARKSRILFGSCTSLAYPQPLWPAIILRNAAAFVWVGDAIYADKNIGLNYSHFPPRPIVQHATPERLDQLYKQQLSDPGYREFLNTNVTVFGTIDDHDYGSNNGDRTYPFKRESAMAFVDFTGESADSPIAKRARQGLGLYGVKVFDFDRPLGHELVPDREAGLDPDMAPDPTAPTYSKKSVAVFVLDSRSNKTPWTSGWQKFYTNYDGDFLGERQWEWFETAISRSRASVNIIAQGLQVHSNKYPDGNVAEEWSRFPRAQQRLYNAVLKENVKAPILVSGDVHMAEFMRKDCLRMTQDSSPRNVVSGSRSLVELTTSGMTHSWGTQVCSRPDLLACRTPYMSFVAKTFMTFAHFISPWTELLEAPQPVTTTECGGAEGAKIGKQFSLDLNFGELEFDWDNDAVKARILGRNDRGKPLMSAVWTFGQLTGREPMTGGKTVQHDFHYARKVMLENSLDPGQWTCVNYRGHAHQLHYALGVVSSMSVFFALLFLPLLIVLLLCALLFRGLLRNTHQTKPKLA